MTVRDHLHRVAIGTEFRSVRADCNVLWRVIRKISPGVWEAIAVNEPFEVNGQSFDSDFAGETDVFKTSAIAQSLSVSSFFQERIDEADRFWDSQPLGAIVHYCNGFEQYVRNEVVEHEGKRMGKPIALVGPGWRPYDLVSRTAWGEEKPGYHARKVLENADPKNYHRASTTCVYEAPDCSTKYKNGPDPRTMDPIVLAAPQPTAEQLEEERIVRGRNDLKAILETPSNLTPREQLEAAADFIRSFEGIQS